MTTHLQQLFPQQRDLIYLNHAAVSPWPDTARQAVADFAMENVTVGSSNYLKWLQKEQDLKQQICTIINAAHWEDIALQKNTSEALSVVAYGLDWKKGDNVVSIQQEFPSNRIVWDSLVHNKGIEFRQVDISTDADCADPEEIEEKLIAMCDNNTRLMSISSVQFASGIRHNLQKLGKFCHNNHILFCVDAIQSVGAMEFNVQDDYIDFAMADGHKWMMGPEGLGFLYVRPALREQINLLQFGWHMTDDPGNYDRLDWSPAKTATRFECGSPNMLGIHALKESLKVLIETGMPEVEKAILERTSILMDYIRSEPDMRLHTPLENNRHAGIINFSHRKIDSKILFNKLSANNICCALRGEGIRLSPHFYTPLEKLTQTNEIIGRAISR